MAGRHTAERSREGRLSVVHLGTGLGQPEEEVFEGRLFADERVDPYAGVGERSRQLDGVVVAGERENQFRRARAENRGRRRAARSRQPRARRLWSAAGSCCRCLPSGRRAPPRVRRGRC